MTFKMLELSEETEGINFLLFGSLKTFKTPIAIDAFGWCFDSSNFNSESLFIFLSQFSIMLHICHARKRGLSCK